MGFSTYQYVAGVCSHTNLEVSVCLFVCPLQCIRPRHTGEPTSEAQIKFAEGKMKNALNVVESYFLKNKKFVAGDEMSIADLLFLCEVTQYWNCNINLCEGRPNMTRWLSECQKILAPHFDELHKRNYELRDSKVFSLSVDLRPN